VSALSLLLVGSASAADFELAQIQTKDMRLLYQDPAADLPDALRRALHPQFARVPEAHPALEPDQEVTVVLTDTADWSNGRAMASPRNIVVAECRRATTSSRRCPATSASIRWPTTSRCTWRRWTRPTTPTCVAPFFGGKPREIDEHPETILYNYLATPRNSTPRWFNEGSAVFFETWLAGGVGRAQGGYDEMVFRAMVRDDAHFYSPVGIVAAGAAADFQTMSNAYLYGTRFMSYLGLTYGPEKVADWLARDQRIRPLLRHPVPARVRQADERGVERLDRLGA
jgi:hypothetical protein